MPDIFFGLFGLIAVLIQILFWGAVIFVAVKLIKRSNSGAGPPRSSALAILEERYARGEITQEEFNQRRAVLRERHD